MSYKQYSCDHLGEDTLAVNLSRNKVNVIFSTYNEVDGEHGPTVYLNYTDIQKLRKQLKKLSKKLECGNE